jgi:hypothetical protein
MIGGVAVRRNRDDVSGLGQAGAAREGAEGFGCEAKRLPIEPCGPALRQAGRSCGGAPLLLSRRAWFETGDGRYAWLNNIVSFTRSRTGDGGVIHRFYAVN